jgi:hypothetical protein
MSLGDIVTPRCMAVVGVVQQRGGFQRQDGDLELMCADVPGEQKRELGAQAPWLGLSPELVTPLDVNGQPDGMAPSHTRVWREIV